MLKGLVKHRARHVLAIYAEPNRVEVLRAHRKWRKWEIEPTEHFALLEGDNLFDFLQRLNLRSRGKGTALLLFLPLTYYSFHRELYPGALGEQLDEALAFDWQENLFYENERTLNFSGPSVPVNNHLSVPIFSLQRGVYDKFEQVLGGSSFQTFAVIPSALSYGTFLAPYYPMEDETSQVEFVGRMVDPTHLEIHRFHKGLLLDSMVVGRDQDNLRLLRESMACIGDGGSEGGGASVSLFCMQGECEGNAGMEWVEESLPVRIRTLSDSLISHWVRYVLDMDEVKTFTVPLILKPWKVPKAAWFVVAMVALYSVFAAYQLHSFNQQRDTYQRLNRHTANLETQWKPIEQLQTRIAKFQEDQKTLSQFSLEGYPLLEMLTFLTQITPEDTWLNYFSVRKGQLMLRGESKSAIKYLPELSRVEGFTDVRFASPVTRNPASDQERFNVQLQLDPEKFRKTVNSMALDKEQEDDETVDLPLSDIDEVNDDLSDDTTAELEPKPAEDKER